MKTTNRINHFVVCSLLLIGVIFNQAGAQDRGSVWVHGLNSAGSDWTNWERLFTNERQMFGANLVSPNLPSTYFTSDGVVFAANRVRSSYAANNRNIYFGHSMGGVIGRQVDVTFPNSVGGFVTFGSPFDGAKIANSIRNGQSDSFINTGVDKVTRGPVRQLGVVVYLIWDLAVKEVVTKFIRDEVRKNYSVTQGSMDLEEASPYMTNGIRSAQTATPKIHVYGNEESPVLWRYASSANEFRNGRSAFNDTYFVGLASTAGNVYETSEWVNYGLAAATAWYTFGLGAVYYYWVGDGWRDGKNWWRTDSENGWNSLIGASDFSYKAVSVTIFDYNLYSKCLASSSYNTNTYTTCGAQAQITTTYYYYSPVNGQSDAFIKAPSQTGYNSAWSNNAKTIEAKGVNHIEMLDNDKIRIIMNGIFDRTTPGIDPFFLTLRR